MKFLAELVQFGEGRKLAAIIVPHDRFDEVKRFMDSTVYDNGDWNRDRVTYRGAPFVCSDFFESYAIEDTPHGPMVHMLR